MKQLLSAIVLLACVALPGTTVTPQASGNIGIFALVQKVVFEPGENDAKRVQIWGAFAVPRPNTSGQYKAAQRGYLYFTAVPDRETVVRKEWADLKAVAGSGQAIGFANYWVRDPNSQATNLHRALEVRVHKPGDAPEPDVYPLGIGVVKLGVSGVSPVILGQLRQALRAKQ